MKLKFKTSLFGGGLGLLALLSGAGSAARAQSYNLDWYKVAGGGGTSAGGGYSVSGTIGQPDAGGAQSGGGYSLTGGFWSIISVVPGPGVPGLSIVRNGPNSVKILWPDPATNQYTLQQNVNLAAGTWAASGYTAVWTNGTNSITITPPLGNLFFRLQHP